MIPFWPHKVKLAFPSRLVGKANYMKITAWISFHVKLQHIAYVWIPIVRNVPGGRDTIGDWTIIVEYIPPIKRWKESKYGDKSTIKSKQQNGYWACSLPLNQEVSKPLISGHCLNVTLLFKYHIFLKKKEKKIVIKMFVLPLQLLTKWPSTYCTLL